MIRDGDLPFIFYNNRSIDGVVMNFMADPRFRFNPYYLMAIDNQLERANKSVVEESTLVIEKSDLDLSVEDVSYTPRDLIIYKKLLERASAELLNPTTEQASFEREWLLSRGITDQMISRYKLGSMSYVCDNTDDRGLEVLGISCHPSLKNLLLDDLSGGGVMFPLFRAGRLVNCTVRRISDVGKLKYSQSCPDIDVWGLRDVDPELPVWMVEGLFDMAAVNAQAGNQAVSVSGAMWSSLQLYQLTNLSRDLRIFADNDRVGLRTAAVLKEFFSIRGVDVPIYISTKAKDPAEHFLEMGLGWSDVLEIEVDQEMIKAAPDTVFNLTNYLKNRRF